jgi:glucan biosynthesis protein C
MDALRSVLMLLGVVLHSARPYDSDAWQVKDQARLPALDWLVSGIHLFRMPAFFVVAGYFAMYLLVRWPVRDFLRDRMRRVLVPLLATLLTFNLLQVRLVIGAGSDAGFLQGALLPAWVDGQWVSHLWFLFSLAVYFALAAMFAPYLRRLADPHGVVASWLRGRWALPFVLLGLVATPLAVVAVGRLAGPGWDEPLLGSASPAELLLYLPGFLTGLLLCASPELLDRFARRDRLVIALAVSGWVVMLLTQGRSDYVFRAAHFLGEGLLRWMVVRVLFSLFREWANRPSRTFAYLSSASYSIYLFHHVTVIATATALLSLPLAAGIKFLIVLATASVVSLALHHFLVRRYAVLGYLFNGRKPVQHDVRPTAAAPEWVPPASPAPGAPESGSAGRSGGG